MLGTWTCVCVQARKFAKVYVVVVAAACLAVLAGAVKLSLAMLPRPVVRQQRKSGRGLRSGPTGCVGSSPFVLWSKALERSSMGLPPSAAELHATSPATSNVNPATPPG